MSLILLIIEILGFGFNLLTDFGFKMILTLYMICILCRDLGMFHSLNLCSTIWLLGPLSVFPSSLYIIVVNLGKRNPCCKYD